MIYQASEWWSSPSHYTIISPDLHPHDLPSLRVVVPVVPVVPVSPTCAGWGRGVPGGGGGVSHDVQGDTADRVGAFAQQLVADITRERTASTEAERLGADVPMAVGLARRRRTRHLWKGDNVDSRTGESDVLNLVKRHFISHNY